MPLVRHLLLCAAAPAESVNPFEVPSQGFYRVVSSFSGGSLIQAVTGSLGGAGGLRTNRSGWVA